MGYNYEEDPGVKKLAKGYGLLPREVLSGFSGIMIDVVAFVIVYSIVTAFMVYAFSHVSFISSGWVIAVMVALGIMCLSQRLKPMVSWTLNDHSSPVVINKNHRDAIKEARRLSKHLGPTVVPVLTTEHVNAIQKVRLSLLLAASNTSDREITIAPHDNDRLTVLLLEDLKREPLLLDLINNRGLTTMIEIEAALRGIEEDTIGPVQSGWL